MGLYVVLGPPAGGKTTWVQAKAKPGDVVIDMDALANALTVGEPTHQHPPAVLRCAQRARGVAIDEALKHCARTDVYVIHAQPSAPVMDRYREHDAQVITIDPGKAVVMARIAEQRHHTTRAVAARWYASPLATPDVTHGDGDPSRVVHSRSW